ncbi:hypothetical protein [Deinococcus aquaedulcis]|uniref:hypothetical protein n=1 Tax=Deinococcus aquaedulcis TaxID=2840455 RepID=UPI001C83A35C|nr:hypothetical protein [Deinococcus aquaedulcis]
MKKPFLFLALTGLLTACVPGSLRHVFGNSWENEALVQLVGQNINVVTARVKTSQERNLLGQPKYVIRNCQYSGRTVAYQNASGTVYAEREVRCGNSVFLTDQKNVITAYYEEGDPDFVPYLLDTFADVLQKAKK